MKYLMPMLLVLNGCANTMPVKRVEVSSFTIESEDTLKGAVNWFMTDCNRMLSKEQCEPKAHLTVRQGNLSEGTLGLCWFSPKQRLIEIDSDVISSQNYWVVLYHEMFHCVLGREHYDNDIDIMNTYEDTEKTLVIYANWEQFLRKVFLRD